MAALATAGTVTFDCGPSPVTITVTSRKTIAADTVLDGGGLITLNGGNAVGVLEVESGVSATIANLDIVDASSGSSYGGAIYSRGTLTLNNVTFEGNHSDFGGAIFNDYGVLLIQDCTFSNNSSDAAGGAVTNYWGTATISDTAFDGNYAAGGGAAILSYSLLTVSGCTFTTNSADNVGGAIYSGGRLVVANSTFTGNSGVQGGAIYKSQGPLTVSGSTFVGNISSGPGGAIYLVPGANTPGSVRNSSFSGNTAASAGGGISAWDGPLTVSNSTFAGNSAPFGSAVFHPATGGPLSLINCTVSANSGAGGAVRNDGGSLTLINSIAQGSLVGGNCTGSGAITDGGHNLDSDGTCGVGSATDPLLDPAGLADNGGPTQTIALLGGSPAIDAGDQSICAAPPVNDVDQRGFVRPGGGGATHCSIGAYERASSGATSAVCGNGSVELGEACDDGAGNSDTVPNACRSDCSLPRCGDDVADSGEQCDNGDLQQNTGCWAACVVETGWTCSGSPSACTGICGDGMTRGGESCDDGNLSDGDGCSSICHQESGFYCSGGPNVPSVCTPNCGDGMVVAGEQCDDGNFTNSDGCSTSCMQEAGWDCSGSPSVCATVCGDNAVAGDETCDDGNLIDDDGCDSNCTLTGCGNGVVTAGEDCDDGNLIDGDGCSPTCVVESGFSCSGGSPSVCGPLCGNESLDPGEECDDGPGNSNIDPDACRLDCTLPICGDGVVDTGEACDGTPAGPGIGRITVSGRVTIFPLPSSWPTVPRSATGIATGPDGNIWFTGVADSFDGTAAWVGRMTPTGIVTKFPLPADTQWEPQSTIAVGPDDNLWLTGIGRIDPTYHPFYRKPQIGRLTTGGTLTTYSLPAGSVWTYANCVAAGADGNLWFTGLFDFNPPQPSSIGRVTPDGSVTTFPLPGGIQNPNGIAQGPDGNMWFTGYAANTGPSIGRIMPDGTVTAFPLPPVTLWDINSGGLSGIVAGPDGNMWFTGIRKYDNFPPAQTIQVGRITTDGTLTAFSLPAAADWRQGGGIAVGPDDNLWFTGLASTGLPVVGRTTRAGAVTLIAQVAGWSTGSAITLGPDGNLWFSGAGGGGKTVNSDTQPGACRLSCTLPVCGDGVTDPGEQCDDGNATDGDGCDSNCTLPICGNGVAAPDENCDDGNLINGDGCDYACNVENGFNCLGGSPSVCSPVCGDGIVLFPKIITQDSSSSAGEQCDDGNLTDGDGCNSDCVYTPVSETVGAGGTVTTDVSANGATAAFPVQASVTTPDGGTVSIIVENGSGPSPIGFESLGVDFDMSAPPASAVDPLVLVFLIHESVVPPNLDADAIQLFKDGVVVPACTGPPGIASPDPCVADRELNSGVFQITALTSTASIWSFGFPICHDGLAVAGEQCDDGNFTIGDGCFDCLLETGWECDGSPSVCTPTCGDGIVVFPKVITQDSSGSIGEQCDDGNLTDGDGCDSDCGYTPVSETVGAGGTVTTDISGNGATAAFPVQASVTAPNGGTVSIAVQNASGSSPAGFESLGLAFDISAPSASASDPLVLVFLIHESVVPPGLDENSIQLFRNGVLVSECTGPPGVASPDPCVSDRQFAGGVFQITALTSAASVWSFAVPICGDSVTEPGEECDDGNTTSGDCCSSSCHFEAPGSTCADDGVDCTTDACDGGGGCQHAPSNAACADADPCTQDSCSPTVGCEHSSTAVTSCANNAPGKAQIMLVRNDAKPTKNKVQFQWLKGTFDGADFGDPRTGTDYALCVYGGDGVVVGLEVPAGPMTCGTKPCWSVVGSPATSVKYSDKQKPLAHDGVKLVKGKASASGKAKLQFKAQGSTVPAIALGSGLTYPVTAQVVTSDGACWGASFTQPDEKKNDGATFKATSSAP